MSKKQLEGVKSKSRDTGGSKANIFKLGAKIKRHIYSYAQYNDTFDNFRFAEACLIFLEEKHPDKLKALKFDAEFTDLAILTGQLARTITDGCLHYIIKNDSQDSIVRSESNYQLEFLKPFGINLEYFVFDIKSMWQLDEKLRIGYAHMLNTMQQMSEYQGDFFTEEYNNKTYLDGMDVKDLAEELEQTPAQIKQMFKRYCNALDKFKDYTVKDLNLFLNYKPRTKEKKLIWECLNAIHKISLRPFHKFADNCDHYEHGMSSYSDLLIPLINKDDNFGEFYIQRMENNFGYSGVTYPSTVTTVRNGKIHEWHTEDDILEFYRLCSLLTNLTILLNK